VLINCNIRNVSPSFAILSAYRVITLEIMYRVITLKWCTQHAKSDAASGYCYVNDVVIGVLELLTWFDRVMYIDIDVHHGDGVEEAFCYSKSVLTCSFHHHAPLYFPGTGAHTDQGGAAGTQAVLNVPLREGCSDATFLRVFRHGIYQWP